MYLQIVEGAREKFESISNHWNVYKNLNFMANFLSFWWNKLYLHTQNNMFSIFFNSLVSYFRNNILTISGFLFSCTLCNAVFRKKFEFYLKLKLFYNHKCTGCQDGWEKKACLASLAFQACLWKEIYKQNWYLYWDD